jgi:hypothetical protein
MSERLPVPDVIEGFRKLTAELGAACHLGRAA